MWSGAEEPHAGRVPQQERVTRGSPRKPETWMRHVKCTEYNNESKENRLGMERSQSPQGEFADKYQHYLLSLCRGVLSKLRECVVGVGKSRKT